MSKQPQAQIWIDLFRLGLTKEMVKRYLKPTKHQVRDIWIHPYTCLTFPQFQKLHSLVCSHYTLEELSRLLLKDEYRPNSELQDNIRKCVVILLTEDGQRNFDEFKARKGSGKPKNGVRKAKAEKFARNRKAFVRLSDPVLSNETDLNEFLIEHERKQSGSYVLPPVDTSRDSDGPKVSI